MCVFPPADLTTWLQILPLAITTSHHEMAQLTIGTTFSLVLIWFLIVFNLVAMSLSPTIIMVSSFSSAALQGLLPLHACCFQPPVHGKTVFHRTFWKLVGVMVLISPIIRIRPLERRDLTSQVLTFALALAVEEGSTESLKEIRVVSSSWFSCVYCMDTCPVQKRAGKGESRPAGEINLWWD